VAGYQHDHDDELPHLQAGQSAAQWVETGSLVREYLMKRAGHEYSELLREGFVRWLQRWPAERQQYLQGTDRQRAALVDWYLKVVRDPFAPKRDFSAATDASRVADRINTRES
jgi:hypothetical protein